ncbi:MAG TPA: methylamine methyltransferase corrinoid protein reductive activase [Candidatus Methanomethylophilaceae archaeon]|nr:methylamine methyltransferase corrinoid protein reductive activase [Candidatus Methanomethylophilaceae archaeon]
MKYGISLDLGTSGFRAHAVDLETNKILSTSITECHPLPGANIMDHLTFSVRVGLDVAHGVVVDTVNKLIKTLGIDLKNVVRMSLCGNPIQLSIAQNIPVDDLAFAGENARRIRGIKEQKRDAGVFSAVECGFEVPDKTELYVPPAIRHEIGADALAMMLKSGFLDEKRNCMVTDYGTNAEMALKVGDDIYTGSAAAGPAMEGQSIKFGMLAAPGAISDLEYDFQWICKILDGELIPQRGNRFDFILGTMTKEGLMQGKAKGITGTGVIACVAVAKSNGLFRKGKLQTSDGKMHLQDGIYLTSEDVVEAMKAIGAMRAGHYTLVEHAGINLSELDTMYMTGASGTYVDAVKGREIGMLPPTCNRIFQYGNTSLALSTDLLMNPELLDKLQDIANDIRANHVMFAGDQIFEEIYIQELSLSEEGMSMSMYNENLERAGLQQIPRPSGNPKITRMSVRDIADLGERGLYIMHDLGTDLVGYMNGCTGCGTCQRECPEDALIVGDDKLITVKTKNCLGTACYRCQYACPEKVMDFDSLKLS